MVRSALNLSEEHVRRMVERSTDTWWHRRPGETAARNARKEHDMPSFNKVMMMGNLTRDPQLKHLASNTVVAEFGLACNRKWRDNAGNDKEEVAFVDCTAFGRQAETIGQYCTKGKGLFVEGRLKYDTWDDKGGGGKRSKLTVVVENFQFLGGKGDTEFPADAFTPASQPAARPPQRQQRPPTRPPRRPGDGIPDDRDGSPFGDEKQFEEDSIPF